MQCGRQLAELPGATVLLCAPATPLRQAPQLAAGDQGRPGQHQGRHAKGADR